MREPPETQDHHSGGARRLNLIAPTGKGFAAEATAWSHPPFGAHRRAVLDTLLAHLADLDAYRQELAALIAEVRDGLADERSEEAVGMDCTVQKLP